MPHFRAPVMTLFSKRLLSQKAAVRHPIKIATIRLQWNRKPKMMPPAKVVLPHKPGGKFSSSGSSSETQKGFVENVRHVEA
jgi:hypothetical protein